MKKCLASAAMLACVGLLASCDMMEQSYEDCPSGLYVNFKYDYNLQRADMFNDHVGSVTLYIFDEAGKLVRTQEESNIGSSAPLASPTYAMHVTGLAPGKYRFLALAGQKPYSDMLETGRAKFIRSDMPAGSDMQDLEVQLDRTPADKSGKFYEMLDSLGIDTEGDFYNVENNGLPLDTLWHGMLTEPVEVYPESSYRVSYATVPLVRDTKQITVSLRELDDPTKMDVNDYDFAIIDHNPHILWDNSLDEADAVVYRPFYTWNTYDRTPATDPDGNVLDDVGRIGHADFMTSRLIYHDDPADDGHLIITNNKTDVAVAHFNLPDILSQLRTSESIYRYDEQEFLDRGYEYQIDVFLRGGNLAYINISISVLGWSKRIQFVEF